MKVVALKSYLHFCVNYLIKTDIVPTGTESDNASLQLKFTFFLQLVVVYRISLFVVINICFQVAQYLANAINFNACGSNGIEKCQYTTVNLVFAYLNF